jgi:hypothetical protein
MVAGYPEHFMALALEPIEKLAGLFELFGPRPLSKIAGNDNEIRFQLIDAGFYGFHQPIVVGAKVKVGQMN